MKKIDLHPNLLLVQTEKEDGNIDFRFGAKDVVTLNRRTIFKSIGLKANEAIEGHQIHSDRILPLNSENTKMWRGMDVPGVDGFLSDEPESIVLIKLADCAVVVIYDPEHQVMGVVHAGWKGTVKKIHTKALAEMERFYSTDPKKALIWIGPAARSCCYSFSKAPDQKDDPEWQDFISQKEKRWHLDIPGFIRSTLMKAGVRAGNIKVDARCTIEDENLFSATRSKETGEVEGRFGVIVSINKRDA